MMQNYYYIEWFHDLSLHRISGMSGGMQSGSYASYSKMVPNKVIFQITD
jgi:hypothetical protein